MPLIDRSVHNHSVIVYMGNPNRALITNSGYRYEKKGPVINIADRFNSYSSFVISVGPEYKDDALFSFDCDGGFVLKSAAGFTFNKEILDVNLQYRWKNTNPSGMLAGRIKEKILDIIESIAKADVNLTMGFASALKDIYFFYTNLLGINMGQELASHMKTLLYFITQGKITLPEKETAIFDDFDFTMPDIGVHKVYITLVDNPNDSSINQAIQDMKALRLMPRLLSYAKKLEAYQKSQRDDLIYEPLQLSPYDRSNSYGFFSGLRVKQLPLIRINDIKKAIENKDIKVTLLSVDTDGKKEEIDIGLTLIEAFAFSFGCYIYANSNQTYRPLLSLLTSIAQRTYPGITEDDLWDLYMCNFGSGDLMDNIIDKFANGALGLKITDDLMATLAFYWCNEITLASKEFAGNMIGTFLLEFFDYEESHWNVLENAFISQCGNEDIKIKDQDNKEKELKQKDLARTIVSYLKKYTLSGAPRNSRPKVTDDSVKKFIEGFIDTLASCKHTSPFVTINPFMILLLLIPTSPVDAVINLPRIVLMGNKTLTRCTNLNFFKNLAKFFEANSNEERKKAVKDFFLPQSDLKFSLVYMITKQNNMDIMAYADLIRQKISEVHSLGLRNDSNYMESIVRQVYSSPDEIKKFTSVKNAAILVAQKLVEMLSKLGFIMFLPPGGYNFIPDFRAIVAAIVNDVPCVQLFSSTDNIEDDNVTYVISYYGIVMRNVKRMKLLNDNTLTQQALLYLLPENITIESSKTFTYSSSATSYGRLGYPTWVKLSITFKPMHKWIFFFGNYYNLKLLYDLLETDKALAMGRSLGGGSGGTGISDPRELPNIPECNS